MSILDAAMYILVQRQIDLLDAGAGGPRSAKGVDSVCLYVGEVIKKKKKIRNISSIFLVICFAHSNLLSLVCRSVTVEAAR